MTDTKKQIEELSIQLAELRSREQQLSKDLYAVESKLHYLQESLLAGFEPDFAEDVVAVASTEDNLSGEPITTYANEVLELSRQQQPKPKQKYQLNEGLESFIGTNLISKIGILVTIIGVFIGAKYAIDKNLISAEMRVLSGYLAAAALIIVAFRLKAKYESFSSVLMAGGLAVTYFMTYIAYSFYAMYPLWLAFAFMVLITIAAVSMALWYDRKVIALIGQVAAYAIPFLLGNKNGNVFGLFAYITFINFGLLALSFKKDWKILYHIAFFLTWLIYLFWLVVIGDPQKSFYTGLIFLTVNFFTFYVTFLSYKIYRKEIYQLGEIAILLFNALFYFFLGTHLISETFTNTHFLTWFTLANAAVHFCVGYFIYRLKLADETVFQFILGLGLLFITVAIPIELDGSWVTLLWTIEATTLFYIAVKNKRPLYLDIALPLTIIAIISLLQDWTISYPHLRNYLGVATNNNGIAFFNLNFVFSLFVSACFGYISYNSAYNMFAGIRSKTARFFEKQIPVCFLAMLYFTFFNEIIFAFSKKNNFAHVYPASTSSNINLNFESSTLIIYSCVYLAIWLLVNNYIIKKAELHHLLIAVGFVLNAVFLFEGLNIIGDLRTVYLTLTTAQPSESLIYIRYLVFAAAAFLWVAAWIASKNFKRSAAFSRSFSTVFNITLLSIVSNEFINWMDLAGYQNQYKLGLSLIGGAYALALIFAGIIKNKKHLRVSAMVLFSVTLLKLFFYDLASLSTISKTVVLVLLGIILLLASFLYNKYKKLLFNNEESQGL